MSSSHSPAQGFSPPAQGNLMLPVFIGCPPGKRLAFDITYTLEYNRLQNKHYFDCVHVDLEMPCFHFRDSACPVPSSASFIVFYPHHFAFSGFPLSQLTSPPILCFTPSSSLSLFPPPNPVLHFSGQANFPGLNPL